MLSQQEESDMERENIKTTDKAYLNYQRGIDDALLTIEAFKEGQQMALSHVIDYSEALTDLEQEIIAEMLSQGVTGTNLVEIKYKEHKKVNPLALKHVLDDEDAFMTLIDVKQKTLKDFAKDNESIKKALLSCIEVTKREPVGLTLKG